MGVVLRRLTVVLVCWALGVAGCGGSGSGPGASAPATQAVEHALTAIQDRAYRETFSENVVLDTSHLPSSEASQLSSVGGTITGSAEVTNSRNFHIVVTIHGSRVYVRAVNGQLSVSADGVNYQPAPAATARRFSQLVNLAPGILGHVTNASSLGSAEVSGQPVSRYSATIPASAVTPAFSSLGASSNPGALRLTVYVSRTTGLPVRFIDDESASVDLSKLGHPGVTGTLSVKVTGVREFVFR